MKIQDLVEQTQPIGISVFQSGRDVSELDFQVFSWPDPNNTIADQSRYLDARLNRDEERLDFLEDIKKRSRSQRKVYGVTVFGPFRHIKNLVS